MGGGCRSVGRSPRLLWQGQGRISCQRQRGGRSSVAFKCRVLCVGNADRRPEALPIWGRASGGCCSSLSFQATGNDGRLRRNFPYLPVTSVSLDMHASIMTLGSAAKDCRSALVPMAVDPICEWINTGRVSASVAVLQPPKTVPHPPRLCGCVASSTLGSLPMKAI